MELHSIGNLRMMEVIDIKTGSKLGYIKDLLVDCNQYKIISLIVPTEKNSWFGKNDDIEIKWDDIVKIGKDVILVNINNSENDDK